VPHVLVQWKKVSQKGPALILAVPYDLPDVSAENALARQQRVAAFIGIVTATVDATWPQPVKLLFFAASGRDEGGRSAARAALEQRGIQLGAWIEFQRVQWPQNFTIDPAHPSLASLKISPPLSTSAEGYVFYAPQNHAATAQRLHMLYTKNTTISAYALSSSVSSFDQLMPDGDFPAVLVSDLQSFLPTDTLTAPSSGSDLLQASLSLERFMRTLGQEGI
jgi:hypothetical protein